MKALLGLSLSLALCAWAAPSAVLANEPLMKIRGVQGTKPLAVFSEPGRKSDSPESIPPEQFASLVNLPVLEERGTYIRIRLADGKPVWILSEKVRLERSAHCGSVTPADTVTTVKRETNAARGIGEACAKGGK